MLIFLNLTVQSFGPENFEPLVQIGKFQKSLLDKTKTIKWCIHSQHTIFVGKISSKTKTARTYAPTQYHIIPGKYFYLLHRNPMNKTTLHRISYFIYVRHFLVCRFLVIYFAMLSEPKIIYRGTVE
jgi:hypothetical protein